MDNQIGGKGELPTQPNMIGQPTGKLGPYIKAPPMDRNHVAEEKGTGDLNQLGFNTKLGV